MGTKRNPGSFDCYAALGDDEPYFLVRAHDKDAPLLVKLWALMRESAVEAGIKPRSDLAQVNEAKQCAYEMERWRRTHDGDDRQMILTVNEIEKRAAE